MLGEICGLLVAAITFVTCPPSLPFHFPHHGNFRQLFANSSFSSIIRLEFNSYPMLSYFIYAHYTTYFLDGLYNYPSYPSDTDPAFSIEPLVLVSAGWSCVGCLVKDIKL